MGGANDEKENCSYPEQMMKKKIALIQMDVAMAEPEKNYVHALELMKKAMMINRIFLFCRKL